MRRCSQVAFVGSLIEVESKPSDFLRGEILMPLNLGSTKQLALCSGLATLVQAAGLCGCPSFWAPRPGTRCPLWGHRGSFWAAPHTHPD